MTNFSSFLYLATGRPPACMGHARGRLMGLLLPGLALTQAPAATFASATTYGTSSNNTQRIALVDVNGET